MGDCRLIASSSYDQTVRLYDMRSGQPLNTVAPGDSQVNTLAFVPGGYHLALGSWQKLRIYDISSAQPQITSFYDGATKNITAVGFEGPHARWVYAGGDDGQCRVFDYRGTHLQCQKAFEVTTGVTSVILHCNGVELFVADQSGAVYIWDLTKKDSHEQIPMPALGIVEFVTRLAVSPNGETLIGITNRGRLVIWSLSVDEESGTVNQHGLPSTTTKAIFRDIIGVGDGCGLSVRYSPNGALIVISLSKGTIQFLSCETFLPTFKIESGCEWNWDAIFSCDSKMLITGGSDNKVKVWDVETRSLRKKFDGHMKPIIALCTNEY